jgi:TerC family integral membrane protein
MIALGAATLQQFEAVNLVFAGILLFSSYKLFSDAEEGEEDLSDNFIIKISRMFVPITSTYDGNKFFTKTPEGVRMATPLLLTLVVLELSDIAFAVDSIPAVFGVTRDPLIIFSSNIFAVLGLRSLFTLISGSMGELAYLQQAVAAVLGFIGSKMVLDFFGFHVPTELSLAVVITLLGAGVGFSLKDSPEEDDNSQG